MSICTITQLCLMKLDGIIPHRRPVEASVTAAAAKTATYALGFGSRPRNPRIRSSSEPELAPGWRTVYRYRRASARSSSFTISPRLLHASAVIRGLNLVLNMSVLKESAL
jgi:hypothetical protein